MYSRFLMIVQFVINKIISSTELKFLLNVLYYLYFLCHFDSKQKVICWNMDNNNTLTDSRQLWNTDISDFRGENRISPVRPCCCCCHKFLSSLKMHLKTVQQKTACRREWSESYIRKKHCFEIKNEKQKKSVGLCAFSERTWSWQDEELRICW